ncbi:MAG: YceD family protein [Thermodesulfobacteriota bacterium]
MLIRIDDITDGGLQIKTQKSAGWVTNIPEIVNETKELSLNKDIDIDCIVTKVLKEICVNGLIQFGIVIQCSRCLKDVDLDLKTDINLTLTPIDEVEDKTGGNDNEFYEGESIDLSNYFREHIAMNIPNKVVCKESCKGLCSKCGIDLNDKECSCEKGLGDSAFAVLKGIKL